MRAFADRIVWDWLFSVPLLGLGRRREKSAFSRSCFGLLEELRFRHSMHENRGWKESEQSSEDIDFEEKAGMPPPPHQF
ncbi:hypothetical protein AVEN_157239-1 [Araneus ventricosus]|uniref:Uncharacterized protein n=1 Tax=Araneus ventricosus TaxID=182803 RepID=A0A4Y2QFQ1_ARAVE|nr:hypothetical protein AVEN_157239-1 [Araneus ventricosus]